jgi:hypothetical protein
VVFKYKKILRYDGAMMIWRWCGDGVGSFIFKNKD